MSVKHYKHMTQQLIIQNDTDSDYVQFTVEIPDGFNSFSISSINGTMINQNYLNVGDSIKFSFSNNPIVYSQAPDIKLTDFSALEHETLDTDFKFTSLDVFRLYRVKFVPIYSYISNVETNSCFVFNPADSTQLLDEPTSNISDYVIQQEPAISIPFTGQFVITLSPVKSINDINVVIGESIKNSKTQPEALAMNEAGELVADNQTGTSYNYGSGWRYNVSNLLLNHKLTVLVDSKDAHHKPITYFVGKGTEFYTTPFYQFNTQVLTYDSRISSDWVSPHFYILQYNTDDDVFEQLNGSCQLPLTKPVQRKILHIVPGSNPVQYEPITYDPDITVNYERYVPRGMKLSGSQLTTSAYTMITINDDDTITFHNDFDFYVYDAADYYYTGCRTTVCVYEGTHLVKDNSITFKNFNQCQLIICDFNTEYSVVLNKDEDDERDAVIKFKEYNKGLKIDGKRCVVGESFSTDDYGRYTFINDVNVGYTNDATNMISGSVEQPISYDELLSQPLQLTTSDNLDAADDDLIIKHVHISS